jgi:hypothetical protein
MGDEDGVDQVKEEDDGIVALGKGSPPKKEPPYPYPYPAPPPPEKKKEPPAMGPAMMEPPPALAPPPMEPIEPTKKKRRVNYATLYPPY